MEEANNKQMKLTSASNTGREVLISLLLDSPRLILLCAPKELSYPPFIFIELLLSVWLSNLLFVLYLVLIVSFGLFV